MVKKLSACKLFIIFLCTICIATSESANRSSSISALEEKTREIFHKISEGTFYLGLGTAFGSASLLARLGWKISLLWSPTLGNEWLLLNHLCKIIAQHAFARITDSTPSPPSLASWHHNQALLSQITAFSEQEQKLLLFLEKRWLAKSTGFFSSVIDWVCPCFGVSVQVNPETTSSYARTPSIQLSQTYKNRMDAWKQSLPHPHDFPLILTRPANIQDYLPNCLDISPSETIETTVAKLATDSETIVDLTHVFPEKDWENYKTALINECRKQNLNLDKIICIQRVYQEAIGGIRVLPLTSKEFPHRFLLDWVSNFGLSANRIELDRWPLTAPRSKEGLAEFRVRRFSGLFWPILHFFARGHIRKLILPLAKKCKIGSKEPENRQNLNFASPSQCDAIPFESISQEEFIFCLNSFEEQWKSNHPQKNLMVQGTLQLLKGLPLKDKCHSIAQLSFSRIKDQFSLLLQEETNFFDTVSHLEQIHANLSTLLEIFNPYTHSDFSPIYSNLLTSIPTALKPLTSYGIHSSAMTTVAGIFKAVGKPLHILYGENTYFECINAAERNLSASPIEEASEKEWKEVDLILAQFNPALKRIDMQFTLYKVEKVAEYLHKALARREKPLTLALDCTLDLINSPRVTQLLEEFQPEIESGFLNIICYRSGLKFDLFGMDNYCGAPFYMIHNQDPKWASFDALLTDPVLQSDRLSINWFCLAYQNAAPQLESYRKQIFENTRTLLSKVPERLFQSGNYRIIPFEQNIDPAFVDIKVFGPFHKMKSAALVGGSLYLKCMEKGHPIFHRPSLGFYHPNFTMLFSEECSTIRLTLGLDPAQIDLLIDCFKVIDALNGNSKS